MLRSRCAQIDKYWRQDGNLGLNLGAVGFDWGSVLEAPWHRSAKKKLEKNKHFTLFLGILGCWIDLESYKI